MIRGAENHPSNQVPVVSVDVGGLRVIDCTSQNVTRNRPDMVMRKLNKRNTAITVNNVKTVRSEFGTDVKGFMNTFIH